MPYQVKFTETTNPAKPSITVEDQFLNSQTSLQFPGKNYAGYGPVIAENFLHLLENFAKNTAPVSPVQGQLWYDNTAGINLLKVFDGTSWTAAGSVKKSNTAPGVSNSIAGDLWVDTENQQLYVYSGSNWLLIGPQFSSGLKTGPTVESIVDTNDTENSVVALYANDYIIAIVSKTNFIPKLTIPGFPTIGQGINLSTVDATSSIAPSKFWGTAEKADSLVVNNEIVASSSFLRGDKVSTSSFPFNVRSNGGISIGSDLSFTITTDPTSTSLYSKTSGNSIDFKVNTSGFPTTALHIDSTGFVGIGPENTNPIEALDVQGNIYSTGNLTVIDTRDATVLGGDASINTAGGASITKQVKIGGELTTYSKVYLNNLDSSDLPIIGPVLLPGTDGGNVSYDIGSTSRRFRNIYAESFVGNFSGSFTGSLSGNITGAAARLLSPTVFSLTGDVSSNSISFNGQSSNGEATFTTTINQDIITSKQEVTDSQLLDQLLVFRQGSGLRKITKSNFIGNIPLVPVGAIFPYAGPIPPAGYLLCDGSEIRVGDYPTLFAIIGYTYRTPALLIGKSTFALPDFRGRFPLGRDNMDNGLKIPDKDDPSIIIDAGGGSANRVTDVTADTLGASSGVEQRTIAVSNLPEHKHTLNSGQAEYFAVGRPGVSNDPNGVSPPGSPDVNTSTGLSVPNTGGVISTRIGQPIVTMNPYQTINYIIFTGVI